VTYRELVRRFARIAPQLVDTESSPLDGPLDGFVAHDRWEAAQAAAIQTAAAWLAGEPIGYRELVERCHGVPARHVDEAEFADAHARLDDALPGRGELFPRYQAWTESQRVPRALLPAALDTLARQLRARTAATFGLPEGERATFAMVRGKPWSGYARYDGNLHTAIDVNDEYPIAAWRLLELVSHEAYPGHHTEHVHKPRLDTWVYCTPQALMSEGIALSGLPALLGEDAQALGAEWLHPLGIAYDAATSAVVQAARLALLGVRANLALGHAERDLTGAQAEAYARHWLPEGEDHARRAVAAVRAQPWPPYEACYVEGLRVCRGHDFGRLLRDRLLPSELVSGG
jgi:hypothetical protein